MGFGAGIPSVISALRVTQGFIWDERNGIYSYYLEDPHSEGTGMILVWRNLGGVCS